jgi:hypothetical protein
MFERAALTLTDHKAFICRNCDHEFYGKLIEKPATTDVSDAGILSQSGAQSGLSTEGER